jgi:hypothetical protein
MECNLVHPDWGKGSTLYYRALYKWKTLEQKLLEIACRVILKGFKKPKNVRVH